VAFIAAAAGFYYYLNVVRALWWANPGERSAVTLPLISKSCIALLTVATLVFGIWPQPILALLK
jgi:NADH:ubiquinone oxidoreductase subunit 2 (subunit N)